MIGDFRFYVPISKRDDEQRMVWGPASSPTVDSQGEQITKEAMAAAIPGYMKFGNVREMHQMSAVGKTKTAEVDENGNTLISAKIVDDDAWKKVKEGVYNGFSIGGRVKSRDPEDAKRITGIDLVEVSLVDRPANPDCVFDVWKAEVVVEPETKTATPEPTFTAPTNTAPVKEASDAPPLDDYQIRKARLRYLDRAIQKGVA